MDNAKKIRTREQDIFVYQDNPRLKPVLFGLITDVNKTIEDRIYYKNY